MLNELIKKIETDLCIKQFNNETSMEYRQRLLYSIAAAWVRTLVFGNSLNDIENDSEDECPDIMYVQANLTNVIDSFIKIMPVFPNWLEPQGTGVASNASGLVSTVIQDMIYLGEIAEIKERKIAHTQECSIRFGNLYWLKGKHDIDGKSQMIGVSFWSNNPRKDEISNNRIVSIPGRDYYGYLQKEKHWIPFQINGDYYIFKVGTTHSYFKSWMPLDKQKIPDGISLIKSTDEINGGHILIRKGNKDIECLPLDPWYINTREIYRIMFALNIRNNTPALFRKKDYGEYVRLQYATALPDYENRIIMSCSWPDRYFDDRFSRIVPKNMWYIIEDVLGFLGIELVETQG